MDYMKTYEAWLSDPYFDEATKQELKAIEGNDNEIKERFYKDLEFGTGGLRGVIGAGTNRMNIYTVRKASQGLADFIIKSGKADKGVAIAYDSRNMSPEFSMCAALCFAANGIKAYLFESLRPTPMLSFALRHLGCVSGVVVTASHNPPEYNGYKVYWEDGAQVSHPADGEIIKVVNSLDITKSKTMTEEEAKAAGLLEIIGSEIDDAYIAELKKLNLHTVAEPAMKKAIEELKIVYTPLHGTGNVPVMRVLKELGFKNVHIVKEQQLPDGNFPTVGYPNPEDVKAFALALDLAKKVDADIVLATDPDADRLGIYAKDGRTGEYVAFTGNMSGMIIGEYVFSQRNEKGDLPKNAALVTTIVTTNMAGAIAKYYGARLYEMLTGFKYIGERIHHFELTGESTYVFGLEESYGCLVGTHARDKDAVCACMMLSEAAAYYKTKGMTLVDQMEAMYKKYGYYRESLESVTIKGLDGIAKMAEIMKHLRETDIAEIGGLKVLAARDYKTDIRKVIATGKEEKMNMLSSDVVYYELENDSWCCVRPSGTEPKIKFYFGTNSGSMEESDARVAKMKESLLAEAGL